MTYSATQNLETLIDKLDHNIDEIKCRALSNILSKLQRGLLLTDSSSLKRLIQKLLRWLDCQPFLNSFCVLNIVGLLISNYNAKSVVVYCGGLATLTRLRNKIVNDDLRKIIDDILWNISDGTAVHDPGRQTHTANQLQTPQTTENPRHASGYFNFSGSSILGNTSSYSGNRQTMLLSGIDSHGACYRLDNANNSGDPPKNFNTHSSSGFAYSKKYVLTFPLLSLTKTDTDVLEASLKSLRSTDVEVALAGIHFFEDVILQDFPAEIFLQRTAFVESLLQILVSSKIQLAHAVTDATVCLCEKLLSRIYYHLDPNSFSTNLAPRSSQLLERSSTNPSLIPFPDRSTTDSLSAPQPTTLSDQANDMLPVSVPVSASAAAAATTTTISGVPFSSVTASGVVIDPNCERTSELDNQFTTFTVLEFTCEVLRNLGHALHFIVTHHQARHSESADPNEVAGSSDRNQLHCRYRLEAKMLHLLRTAVDLFLVSVEPLDRARTNTVAQYTADPVDEFVNWMLIRRPPKRDLICPFDLPPSFSGSLEPWTVLLSTLSSAWVHHAPAVGSVGWNASEFVHLIATNAIPYEYERHLYLAVLDSLFHLINSLFTPETALTVVPADLRAQFSLALLDSSLFGSASYTVDDPVKYGLPAYVTLFNSAICSTWRLLARVQQSMCGLVQFLCQIEEAREGKQNAPDSLLDLAVQGIDSLDIVGSTLFASEFVSLLNQLSIAGAGQNPDIIWRGQLVMLRLLSHNLDMIRKATYTRLFEVVQDATCVQSVANPTKPRNGLDFVLRDEILCELIEFGLKDDSVEIRSLAERILVTLLNAYSLLPQSSWKTLHRLLLMQPLSPQPSSGTVRPLAIALGAHARSPKNSAERDTLGGLALEWCLGYMTPWGRRMSSPEELSTVSADPSETDEAFEQAIHSACRLLMHPLPEVRLQAAIALCTHLRHFLCRSSGVELPNPSIQSDLTRHIEGASSVVSDSRSTVAHSQQNSHEVTKKPNLRTTSTPLSYQTHFSVLSRQLADCFLPGTEDPSTAMPPPPLLDQADLPTEDMRNNDSTVEDQLSGLLRVMQLFANSQSDLGVRRAAGEQVNILVKRPSLLSAWYAHRGLEFACELVLDTARELLPRLKRIDTPELVQPPVTSSSSAATVLLPIVLRILRFAAVWNALIRDQLQRMPDLVLSLVCLRIAHPNSGGLHRDLLDLVSLLVFAPVIQSSEESPVCLPVGVTTGYRLPFVCPTYSFRSLWRDEANGTNPFQPLSELLGQSNEDQQEPNANVAALNTLIRRSFRYSWSMACHESMTTFVRYTLALLGALPDASAVDPVQVDRNFKRLREYSPNMSQLSLSSSELALLLLSHPSASFLLSLTSVQQASSHPDLVTALGVLLRSARAHQLQKDPSLVRSPKTSEWPDSMCWWFRAQLSRFLSTLPACSADFQLLSSLLCTIDEVGLRANIPTVTALGPDRQLCNWLSSVLVDSNGPLAYCLLQPGAGIGQTDSRRLALAKRRLIYHQLPRLLHSLSARLNLIEATARHRNYSAQQVQHETDHSNGKCKRPEFVELCLQWGYNALVHFAQNPFSDLVRLRIVLSVLCELTSSTLWISKFDQPWLWRLLDISTNVLAHFDAGRDEPSESFMGAGSLRLSLTLITQVLGLLSAKPFLINPTEPSTVSGSGRPNRPETPTARSTPNPSWIENEWLLRCLVYRQPETRALVLCILSRLCLLPEWAKRFCTHEPNIETRTLLAMHGRNFLASGAGNLWCIAISALLDPNESCLVRTEAVHLLVNLTALPINPRESGIFLPPTRGIRVSTSVAPLRTDENGFGGTTVTGLQHAPSNPTALPVGVDEGATTTTGTTQQETTSYSRSEPMSAGDRPTVSTTTTEENVRGNSGAIDLRNLFNSELESNEMRENFAQLIRYMQPWFNDLFPPTEEPVPPEAPADVVEVGADGVAAASNQPSSPCLLLHTSTVPRESLLPCCFDATGGFYLLGLPALQQLLTTQNVLDFLRQLLGVYFPQPQLDPIRWNGMISSASTYSSELPDSLDSAIRFGSFKQDQSSQQTTDMTAVPSNATTTLITDTSRSGTAKFLCTPLFVGAMCRLLTNLLHHLPKFVSTEIVRSRLHAFLMNIVDPNLIEVVVSNIGSPSSEQQTSNSTRPPLHSAWLVSHKHLIDCSAGCLHVLRCLAAMHHATRSALKSDALFLGRLIRSLKISTNVEIWAPVWREVFALLTCLLLQSDPTDVNDLNLRLILQPLSVRVAGWLEILLSLIDRAEEELSLIGIKPSRDLQTMEVCCKQARSALNFFTVVLSNYRPLSSNPVITALDACHQSSKLVSDKKQLSPAKLQKPQSVQPDVVVRLTRRLMALVSSRSVLVSKTNHTPRSIHQVGYQRALRCALQTLLGVSRAAKSVAVDDGLLEELVVSMQLLQAKLDLCGLTASMGLASTESVSARSRTLNGPSERQKQQASQNWNLLTDELIAQCEIMYNLVYICPEARRRAIEVGLPQLAHRMWPLALQNVRILHALLALLTNLSADCPYAASALAANTVVNRSHPIACLLVANPNDGLPGSTRNRPATGFHSDRSSPAFVTVDAPGAPPTTTQSIVHHVCRLLGPPDKPTATSDSGPGPLTLRPSSAQSHSSTSGLKSALAGNFEQEVTVRYVYQLLANLVWAPEARTALLKTKLLQRFPELDPRILVKSRRGHFILSLWLQLLTTLSFTKDGQQMLFTQPRLSDVLMSCILHAKGCNRETALLVIRNLCTSPTFKSRLLTGDTHLLNCLRDLIVHTSGPQNQSVPLMTIAVSTIEALIHGNQKVRTLIRSSGFLRHMTHLWTACQKNPQLAPLVSKIQDVMTFLHD